jgi:type I restriction enzyme S subunit
MKKGWQTKTIGDVCEFQRGLTYAKGDEVDISKNVVLRATNIDSATNLLTFDELKYINDEVIVPESKKVKKGSLLICTASGSKSHLGKVAFIDDDYGYAFGGFMGMLTPVDGLLPKYLFHLMTSDDYKDFISALSDGANINNLKFEDLKRFPVPLPPLTEQQRIVGLLDEAFASLATAQAHAAQNLQNARDLFESCIQVEFGKDVALGELVDIKTGKLDANAAEEDGEYPFFTCSRETYAINNYAFDCEAVLLAGNNAVGDFNVKHYVGKFNAYQRTYVITINSRKRAISRYLYYQLQKNLAKFKSQSVGTGTKFLKLGMIKDMMIPLPTIPEQSRIVNQLDALAAETQRLAQIYEQKLAALAALKKSLLHQAFNGEL